MLKLVKKLNSCAISKIAIAKSKIEGYFQQANLIEFFSLQIQAIDEQIEF